MMRKLILAGVAIATIAFSACDEETLNIGNSLTQNSDKLNITSTTLNLDTRTVAVDSVLTLSSECYFGKVKDPETGADVTSEFTTQFHLLESMYISPEDSIMSRWNGMGAADSCSLILYLSSPFMPNDSLLAMKMQVMELDRPTEEGLRYYSNYSPVDLGMVRDGGMKKSKMFTYRSQTDSDSIKGTSTYLDNITITLNGAYTDKSGNTYNNYGTYLMQQYFNYPEYFSNSYSFAHQVCPGFYFSITDGYGFHAKVTDIGLRIHYKITHNDSTYNAVLTLAGTKEVLQTTRVVNDKKAIQELANDNSCTYLKSPAGLFTEVTLPVDDIRNGHLTDSLLAAKVIFQRLNNNSSDKRALGTPSYLLMVQKDSLNSFFEKNKLPDSQESFYSVFSSSTNTYTYSNISNLITQMWNSKQKGVANNPNWLAEHPNWNKVLLVPVSMTVNSSTSNVTRCEHDMSLTSTRLVGGSNNPNDPVNISVVYAKFNE